MLPGFVSVFLFFLLCFVVFSKPLSKETKEYFAEMISDWISS